MGVFHVKHSHLCLDNSSPGLILRIEKVPRVFRNNGRLVALIQYSWRDHRLRAFHTKTGRLHSELALGVPRAKR
jgi:hypothetical protein